MAKGIGNGAPLAAVACTEEIANTLSQRVHFNTYGGNPVSAVAGIATMEYIDDHNLVANCKKMGDLFMEGAKKLATKYPILGDVRGKGLMIGMEFVQHPTKKTPAT